MLVQEHGLGLVSGVSNQTASRQVLLPHMRSGPELDVLKPGPKVYFSPRVWIAPPPEDAIKSHVACAETVVEQIYFSPA